MAFSHEIIPHLANGGERWLTARPSFSSQKTADRLRECERSSPKPKVSKMKPHRTSVFKEEGLDDFRRTFYALQDGDKGPSPLPVDKIEDLKGKNEKFEKAVRDSEDMEDGTKASGLPWYSKLAKGPRPIIKTSSTAPPGPFSSIPRVALIACLIAVVVPGFRYGGEDKVNISGASARVIRDEELVENVSAIEGRQNSPSSICTRWAQQGMSFMFENPVYMSGVSRY